MEAKIQMRKKKCVTLLLPIKMIGILDRVINQAKSNQLHRIGVPLRKPNACPVMYERVYPKRFGCFGILPFGCGVVALEAVSGA